MSHGTGNTRSKPKSDSLFSTRGRKPTEASPVSQRCESAVLIFDILADPPCLCLQEVVSEVQRDESEIHAHFGGCFLNGRRLREQATETITCGLQ